MPDTTQEKRRFSRRGFVGSIAAGAAAPAALARSAGAPAPPQPVEPPLVPITLNVNGRKYELEVEPRWSLLYALREHIGLTGAKPGCERGECGCCTVLMDGVARYACMTLAAEAEGAEITTIEGLSNGEPSPVVRAFVEEDAMQCGYCTPGQAMAVEALLRSNPEPTFDEIRQGVSGNLCRCGAYPHIFNAARKASELRKEKS